MITTRKGAEINFKRLEKSLSEIQKNELEIGAQKLAGFYIKVLNKIKERTKFNLITRIKPYRGISISWIEMFNQEFGLIQNRKY